MKNILVLLIFILTLNAHSQVKSFSEDTNKRINAKLEEKKNSYIIHPEALFVIDGKPVLKENLADFKNLMPENIVDVNSISEDSHTGEIIWSEHAKKGVVMITTNLIKYPESPTADKSQILFVLDNKIISKEDAYAINAAKHIETIIVYKNANKFRLFNGDEYDGILVFTSKVK